MDLQATGGSEEEVSEDRKGSPTFRSTKEKQKDEYLRKGIRNHKPRK